MTYNDTIVLFGGLSGADNIYNNLMVSISRWSGEQLFICGLVVKSRLFQFSNRPRSKGRVLLLLVFVPMSFNVQRY